MFQWVCVSWILFRSQTLADAGALFRSLGDWSRPATLWTPAVLTVLTVGWLVQFLDGSRLEPVWNRFGRLPAPVQGVLCAFALALILGLGPQGVAPFIYFQF